MLQTKWRSKPAKIVGMWRFCHDVDSEDDACGCETERVWNSPAIRSGEQVESDGVVHFPAVHLNCDDASASPCMTVTGLPLHSLVQNKADLLDEDENVQAKPDPWKVLMEALHILPLIHLYLVIASPRGRPNSVRISSANFV